jgi:hypothetical protein
MFRTSTVLPGSVKRNFPAQMYEAALRAGKKEKEWNNKLVAVGISKQDSD